ncbi:MAG: DUF1566 domain-containing protein [Nitrospinae bacterium]|nr:DUF1566 domain-containing protein [Nitrospinota bacterium]
MRIRIKKKFGKVLIPAIFMALLRLWGIGTGNLLFAEPGQGAGPIEPRHGGTEARRHKEPTEPIKLKKLSALTAYPIVKFNGVAAEVASSSDTEIQAKVPVGAATGPISVETSDGNLKLGAGDFQVVTHPSAPFNNGAREKGKALSVPANSSMAFSPKSGKPGDVVTITGDFPTKSSMLKLPDTGQTTCYDNSVFIPCPSTGGDFYGQDANYTINPPSYTDNGDGTVTDNVTTLVWQQKDDAIGRTWDEAGTYCGALSLGGYDDWRLPSINELESIVDSRARIPSINAAYFPNANSSFYWSSTTVANFTSLAWYVYFYYGYINFNLESDSDYVLCVRGGN